MDPWCWRKGHANDSGRRSVGAHGGISGGAAPVSVGKNGAGAAACRWRDALGESNRRRDGQI